METPPKLSDAQARTVAVEVLPPEPPRLAAPEAAMEGPPIHALSALILVAVDSLWTVGEFVVVAWVVTIPLSFLAVAAPVFLIQKFLKKDSNGRALTFATLLGALAAIPTPVTGTPVGLTLLAWSGLGKLLGKAAPK